MDLSERWNFLSVKWFVSWTAGAVLLYKHDLYTVVFIIGAVINALSSKVRSGITVKCALDIWSFCLGVSNVNQKTRFSLSCRFLNGSLMRKGPMGHPYMTLGCPQVTPNHCCFLDAFSYDGSLHAAQIEVGFQPLYRAQ